MKKEETTVKEKKEATEGKKENLASKKLNQDELVDLSQREFHEYRKLRRDEAGAKIQEILNEYEVALDAELRITQHQIVPKIMLVDAMPSGNM